MAKIRSDGTKESISHDDNGVNLLESDNPQELTLTVLMTNSAFQEQTANS